MDRPQINDAVRRGLAHYWSPEQIAGRLQREFPDQPQRHIAPQTIYTWIAEQGDEREHWESLLRRRGRRPRLRRQNPVSNPTRAAIAPPSSRNEAAWAISKAIASWADQAPAVS